MANKKIPTNIEAEQSLLGSMFISKEAIEVATGIVSSEDFYLDSHKILFDTLVAMNDNNIPIDITTVTSELNNKNKINEVGGVEYLSELVNSVPTAANVEYYAKAVKDKSLLRRLINVATQMVTMGYENQDDVDDVLNEAEKQILSIIRAQTTTEFRSIKEVLFKTQSDLEMLSSNKGNVTGLPTGFTDFDKLTAGLQKKDLIILASRPGVGKTAFALNIAKNVAMQTDETVAIFSLEMGAEQLAMRLISSVGKVDGHKLRSGNILNEDWKKINEAISQLATTNIYIDDTPGIKINQLRAKCRRLANSEKGLGLIIVDYLQLVEGSGKNQGNRQQEVSEISRFLKTLAMELDVPIIALSQLSRSVEGREDKIPLMSDLRESGSIEQDADIVCFLYREDYYSRDPEEKSDTSVTELIIGKHRHGPTGTVELLFMRNTSAFANYLRQNN
ncbi:MAG TPA: replicative DNA helicase [Tenericutes bacterium]|nr:replicative DNA helicase [Mycoplasmatota bacterium]